MRSRTTRLATIGASRSLVCSAAAAAATITCARHSSSSSRRRSSSSSRAHRLAWWPSGEVRGTINMRSRTTRLAAIGASRSLVRSAASAAAAITRVRLPTVRLVTLMLV